MGPMSFMSGINLQLQVRFARRPGTLPFCGANFFPACLVICCTVYCLFTVLRCAYHPTIPLLSILSTNILTVKKSSKQDLNLVSWVCLVCVRPTQTVTRLHVAKCIKVDRCSCSMIVSTATTNQSLNFSTAITTLEFAFYHLN